MTGVQDWVISAVISVTGKRITGNGEKEELLSNS